MRHGELVNMGLARAVGYTEQGRYHAKLAAAMLRMEREHVLPIHKREHYWRKPGHGLLLPVPQAW